MFGTACEYMCTVYVNRAKIPGPGTAKPVLRIGTTGTVPRAYDIFRVYKGMQDSKNKKETKKRKI
jgi:hypothetical protein